MSDPTLDDKLIAAQKKLDQRRRAYWLAAHSDPTLHSYSEARYLLSRLLALAVTLAIIFACVTALQQ